MFNKSIKLIGTAVIIVIMSICCSSPNGNPSGQAGQLNSWFDVQRKYAEALDKNLGTEKLYKIVPIMGPIYSIGTPITPGTSSPITHSCKIDNDSLIESDFHPLPIIKEVRTFSLNLGMSDSFKKTLKGIADLGIKVTSIKTMEISYSELSQFVAPEDAIEDALNETNCFNDVRGRKIAFIRGLIRGSMKAISGSSLDMDPTVKIANIGDFTVKYNDKGDLNLEDSKSDRPRFFIVSEIYVSAEPYRDGLIKNRDGLIKNHDGSIKNRHRLTEISKPSQKTLKGLIENTP